MGNLLPGRHYLPRSASSWLIPSSLSFPDGSIINFPFHIIPILQPAIYSLAEYHMADISSRLRKGPVNNRPRDSSLLSSTSSAWKLFLHIDTEWQEVLLGGGSVPFSLWAGSKCAKEIITLYLGLLLLPAYSTDQHQQGTIMRLFLKGNCGCVCVCHSFTMWFAFVEEVDFKKRSSRSRWIDFNPPLLFPPLWMQQTGKVGTVIHHYSSPNTQVHFIYVV